MRKTPGLWIHVAHVAHIALLVIAALDDPRPSTRQRPDPFGARPVPVPGRQPGDTTAAGTTGLPRSVDIVPRCPMPVWRPDPDVHYAAMVVGADAAAPRTSEPAPCVNSYAQAANSAASR